MSDILKQYGIKEVADVTFYELDNDLPGKPVLVLDTLKLSNIEQSAESTDAKGGKGNASLITWDYGKEVILNIEDALFSPKTLSLANGIDYSTITNVDKSRTLERVNVYKISKDLAIWEVKKVSGMEDVWNPLLAEEMIANQVTSKGMLIDGKFMFGTVLMRTMSGLGIDLWQQCATTEIQKRLKQDCFYEDKGKIYLKKGYYLFMVQTDLEPNYKIEIAADTFPGVYYVVGDTYIRDKNTGLDKLF
jgi:hypothetical protein